MANRFFKGISLVLASMMLQCAAVGCSKDSGSSTPSTLDSSSVSSSQTTAPVPQSAPDTPDGMDFSQYEPDPAKTYTIEWLGQISNAPMPDDAELKLYWEQKYNVKFNMWYIERSKWNELLNVRIAANEFPDVICTDDIPTLKGYYDQDMILEMPKELIAHFMPKIYQNVHDISEKENLDAWMVTSINGKNYGIPTFNVGGKYVYTSLWRGDWLKKLGIETPPVTLEDFETVFYQFVNDDPDGNGKKDTYALSSGRVSEPFASIYGAFGYIPWFWKVEDGEMKFGALQPEMKEALSYLAKWYQDGVLNPEFITGENKGGHWSISHDFINGVIGYTNNGPFYSNAPAPIGGSKGGKMNAAFQAAHENDGAEMVVGQAPIGPDGDCGSIRWGVVTGTNLDFSKKLEEEPDKLGKIMTVIEDMCSDYDNWVTMYYGMEGKHYEIKDGTYVDLCPEGRSTEDFGYGNPFVAYTGDFGFEYKWDQPYYDYADKVATYSQEYTNALMTVLPSNDLYWDELDKMQKEDYIQIITGAKPIDYFDEFVAKWKKSGGDILIQEANDWYAAASQK